MAQALTYSVAPEVFARFPGYRRGLVLAYGVTNGPSPAPLSARLRGAEEALRNRLDLATLAEHPRIASWRAAYRAFGARPSEFRSSIEAMARRALRGDPLPSINALVDIGNIVSLEYVLPAGCHAIDVVSGDLALRPARGNEDFVAFGSEAVEHPEAGEIIFVEGNTVLTRRWTWRQAEHTLTRPESTAVEFNIDGLPPVDQAEVEAACRTTAELVATYCGGRVRVDLLHEGHPAVTISE